MTIIEDRESLNEITREAIAQTLQEETEGANRVCEHPYGWGCAEGDVVFPEKTISAADKKRNTFCSAVGSLVMLVGIICGCIMWFADVSLWINIAVIVFVEFAGGVFWCFGEPRDPEENIGVYIVGNIIMCVLHSLINLLVAAIIVAVIEGILWIF